jgi:hypothetical protein
MAQKIYYQFKADDDTFSLNSRTLGIIPPGRYRGYEFAPITGLVLRLVHIDTGYTYPKIDSVLSSPIGVVVSKQGCIITEDTNIELPIVANNVANPRIDLVVMSHEYKLFVGGVSAEYFVIQGTPSVNPTVPTVTDPLKQVVIGQLYLPAGCNNLTEGGVVWIPSDIPEFGNDTIKLQVKNLLANFTTLQQNFTTLQNNFNSFVTLVTNEIATQQQYIEDHVVEFRNNGTMLQWKYLFEDDTAWRNLGVALMMPPSGLGVIEVHIAGNEPLPLQIRDRNIIEFRHIISDANGVWTLNREYTAMQGKTYHFVLDTLQFSLKQDFTMPSGNSRFMNVVYFEIWVNNVKIQTYKVCLLFALPSFTVVPAGTVKEIPQIAISIPLVPGDKFYIQTYIPDADTCFNDNFYDPQVGNFNVGDSNAGEVIRFNTIQNELNNRYNISSGHLYTT